LRLAPGGSHRRRERPAAGPGPRERPARPHRQDDSDHLPHRYLARSVAPLPRGWGTRRCRRFLCGRPATRDESGGDHGVAPGDRAPPPIRGMSHARVDAEGDQAEHVYPEVPDAGTPLALQRAQPAVRAPSQAPPRPRKSGTPLPPLFVVVISGLLGLSVLAAWGLAYLSVFSSVQEHRAQRVLQATFRSQVAEGTQPITGKIASGVPVAVLSIPRL